MFLLSVASFFTALSLLLFGKAETSRLMIIRPQRFNILLVSIDVEYPLPCVADSMGLVVDLIRTAIKDCKPGYILYVNPSVASYGMKMLP